MNSLKLHAIALRRLRLLPVGEGPVSVRKKLTFFSELAGMGYALRNPEAYNDSVLADYSATIAELQAMRGGNVDYVPLFQGFPDKVPDQHAYFAKRIIGYIGNLLLPFEDGKQLDDGFVVPEWLFDLEAFGANPITQLQDSELFRKGVERQNAREGDTHVEWIYLTLADEATLEAKAWEWLTANLYARASIKEALKADIEALLQHFPMGRIDAGRVVFKETRTYLMQLLWTEGRFNTLAAYCDTPTDLLRLFAALTETDISLSDPVKYPKMNRQQRRFVLEQLEQCTSLAEDLNRFRDLWLRIGKGLHPGAHAQRYPRTAAAFDRLRNGVIRGYGSKVERAIADRNIFVLIDLLQQRPGEFARRLHHVLELAGDNTAPVLAAFETVVGRVQLKNLLVMARYFTTIDSQPVRAVVNKRGRMRVFDNRQHRVRGEVMAQIVTLLKAAIQHKITSEKPSWQGQKAWIDPALRSYTVPLQQRKASDGLLTIGRGSRLPLTAGKVLRLFVWWHDLPGRETDLDLSVIKYDDDMYYTGHVSYTNLADAGIVHSGDLQSAPHGAAEFVDLDLDFVRQQDNCRYIASQIHRYCGDRFNKIECIAGWMLRDKVDSDYKSFDIKTVQQKFVLSSACSYAIPILIDLYEETIIFTDIYVNGVGKYNNVEGSHENTSTITKEVARMRDTRPNLHELAVYNVLGRGAKLVEDRDAADVSFGLEGCDYNAFDVGKILSELL